MLTLKTTMELEKQCFGSLFVTPKASASDTEEFDGKVDLHFWRTTGYSTSTRRQRLPLRETLHNRAQILQEALDRCKRDTRRYAKRQMTWIAHQFTLWPRIPSEDLQLRTRVISDIWAEGQLPPD